jgi:sec-independent protein translocase protein TatC
MSDSPTGLESDTTESELENESGKMSFLDHLDELRKRLVHIVAYLGIGFIVGLLFAKAIFKYFFSSLLTRLGTNLYAPDVMTGFTQYMKIAFLAGIFITIPLTLYEVWKFIAPGLYRKEKRYVVPFLFSSVILFLSGAAFCYRIVLPSSLKFLIDFTKDMDITPIPMAHDYIDLINMMLLGFGLIFEMPVIIAFLSMFGLVSASFLWNKFRYSIVIILILAAIISPTGDAFNLMIWSAPMILLYIISIGVAAIFGRRRKARGLE